MSDVLIELITMRMRMLIGSFYKVVTNASSPPFYPIQIDLQLSKLNDLTECKHTFLIISADRHGRPSNFIHFFIY